jgi:hypothetical protein
VNARRRKPDHTVAHDGSRGFLGFECLNCGERQPIVLPTRLSYFAESGKAFAKAHRRCTHKSFEVAR